MYFLLVASFIPSNECMTYLFHDHEPTPPTRLSVDFVALVHELYTCSLRVLLNEIKESKPLENDLEVSLMSCFHP